MSYAYSQKDNLIIKYLPLVKKVIARIEVKNNINDQDDLLSIGVLGLMDAIDRYDKSKNVPFEAYASMRIKGTVLDELRKTGVVSRDKIDKLNQYYSTKETLENKLNRTPSESEIAKELGIGNKQLSKIHETVHYLSSYSLESTLLTYDGCNYSLIDIVNDEKSKTPEEIVIKQEQRQVLSKAIDVLNEREKIILNLYYVEELSLKEIAYILDISIPRVSQIHGKILIKLKDRIKSIMEDQNV
jgi:RNA polymerase sigma factor for flagellar operon FliA